MSQENLIKSGFIIITIFSSLGLFCLFGLHNVPEGHVDVYYRFGKLLPEISETSGLNIKIPLITTNYHISTIFQSDVVKKVECRLKQGIGIIFENVEVFNILNQNGVIPIIKFYGVNYDEILIMSTVRNYIGSICRKYTVDDMLANFTSVQDKLKDEIQSYVNKNLNNSDHLQILSTRLSTPTIPNEILERYKKIEDEKVNARVTEMEKERVMKKLEIDMEKETSVNNIYKAKETARLEMLLKDAGARAEVKNKEAIANKNLLTREYLELKRIEAMGNNTKLFFGTTGENLIKLL